MESAKPPPSYLIFLARDNPDDIHCNEIAHAQAAGCIVETGCQQTLARRPRVSARHPVASNCNQKAALVAIVVSSTTSQPRPAAQLDGASVPAHLVVALLSLGLLRPMGILLTASVVYDFIFKCGYLNLNSAVNRATGC